MTDRSETTKRKFTSWLGFSASMPGLFAVYKGPGYYDGPNFVGPLEEDERSKMTRVEDTIPSKEEDGITEIAIETVPCKWCNRLTRWTGVRMCNRCYELDTRIMKDPELARKILDKLQEHKT